MAGNPKDAAADVDVDVDANADAAGSGSTMSQRTEVARAGLLKM
jgi:hypothetical protein